LIGLPVRLAEGDAPARYPLRADSIIGVVRMLRLLAQRVRITQEACDGRRGRPQAAGILSKRWLGPRQRLFAAQATIRSLNYSASSCRYESRPDFQRPPPAASSQLLGKPLYAIFFFGEMIQSKIYELLVDLRLLVALDLSIVISRQRCCFAAQALRHSRYNRQVPG
jgi:hypothetical protein